MRVATEVDKHKLITKYLNQSDYIKGRYYFAGYIGRGNAWFDKDNSNIMNLSVNIESERTTKIYSTDFKINLDTNEILNLKCDCPQFKETKSCKHLAAVLYYYFDQIFKFKITDKEKEEYTKDLFTRIKGNNEKRKVKEEVKVQYEITTDVYSFNLCLKVGTSKLYMAKDSKLRAFLRAIRDNKEYNFGKNFLYSPDSCYFSKENQEIIEYLILLVDSDNRYYYGNNIINGDYNIKRFLFLLQDKEFLLNNYRIEKITSEFPFNSKLNLENDNYKLKLDLKNDSIPITSDFEYIQVKNTLYHLDSKKASLIKDIKDNEMDELIFNKNDKSVFVDSLLPLVKDNIIIDNKITDIKITKDVKAKLYFDLYKELVICNLNFLYDEELINYFDKDSNVLRNMDYEIEVIDDLVKADFIIDKDKIYLEDIDKIGKFLESDLLTLTEKYETYTSEKLKRVNIIKKNNIKSTFSIGMDNILSYSFDLGGISENEIVNVLESLRNNKKYYRLKSGDILDLENNKDLEELEKLTEEMDLSNSDLKNGRGVIPKYRAIYLDSLKNNKYHIIETNNLFNDLIDKFNKYKDSDISLNKDDLELLRSYQVDGVKWLYNIDKTGFGGILADEMGLGKSIQTIYYIKELLKENKDYKFLIISPTSLAYNWENEFNKFGKNIKYKVISGVRNKRRLELENIKDINVLITTYGLVREDKEIYDTLSFKTVIIDEAQNIKNTNAEVSKCVKSVKADTKLALTGTPIENSLLELWSIFDFIMPGFLANLKTFDKKYKIKSFSEDDNLKLQNLNKLVSPFIMRRRKKDVIKDLPDKIENNIYVDLTKEQKKIYLAELEKVNKEMDEIISEGGISKARFLILQLLTKLRQIVIDPRIIYKDYKGGSGKLDEFVKVVSEMVENGHKMLVFTSFKSGLELAKSELQKVGITSYTIDGSVSSKKRMELVDKFNSDNTNVFFIMLKAGGTGLNLTSADVVIHLDLWWNPQAENQATDRAHRIGQKNVVQVVHFITKGTIEEKILDLQKKKKLLSDKLLDENSQANVFSELSEKDIKDLLSYDNRDDE